MILFELFIIAVGLSMDAFAVAVCAGLSMQKITLKKSLTVGLYFGIFQAVMPLIGYLLATRFASAISTYDHWISFILLGIIGGKMIVESFKRTGCRDRECPTGCCTDRKCPGGERSEIKEATLRPAEMLPLALATSIDALAVGVSFALLDVNIVPAVLSIGFVTLSLSMLGVKSAIFSAENSNRRQSLQEA